MQADFAMDILNYLNDFLWTYILIAMLLGAGLYFSFKNQFVQFRMIPHMFKLLTEVSHTKNGVSSFQAFCMSTASRVGTGNLAGVAIAISIGGPGSVFWMWLIALIGAASAFVESTLAQVYKEKLGDAYVGGPAYYIDKALKNRFLGVVFAILITICFGLIFNSVQSNTISSAFEHAYKFDRLTIGCVLAVFTGFVIFGGVKRIALVSEILVPFMAVIYLGIVSYILVRNYHLLPDILELIVSNALGFKQFAGGTMGAILLQGIKRGLFSNEAGIGSAPNAAATAEVSHPAKQGLIQTLGVFTDTLIICTATALLILVSGANNLGIEDGIQITQKAMESQIGSWGDNFIAISILLFAFSSILGNYYYGESNVEFINKNKTWLIIYRVIVLFMIVLGSVKDQKFVWGLADLFMGLMAIINIYAIVRLAPLANKVLKDYLKQRKAGKNPVFEASKFVPIEDAECWPDKEKSQKI